MKSEERAKELQEKWGLNVGFMLDAKMTLDDQEYEQRLACEKAAYQAVRKYMPRDFPLDIVCSAILNAKVES